MEENGRLVWIEAVELPTALQLIAKTGQLTTITETEAKLIQNGRVTRKKVTLPNLYCPFCGQKYGEELPVQTHSSLTSNAQ